jgi:hypothetical protein
MMDGSIVLTIAMVVMLVVMVGGTGLAGASAILRRRRRAEIETDARCAGGNEA